MRLKILNKQDINLLKRAFYYVKPYKIRYIILFFNTMLMIMYGIIQPLIWGNLIQCLVEKNFSKVKLDIVYLLALYIFQNLTTFWRSYNSSKLTNNMIYDLKCDVYKKILELPMKVFDQTRNGDFMSRIHGDVYALTDIVVEQFLGAMIDILRIIIMGIVVFSINITLGFIVIIAFPFSYIVVLVLGKILREKNKEIKIYNDNYFSIVQQSLLGIRHIKGYGLKDYTYSKFQENAYKIKNKSVQIYLLNSLSYCLSDFIEFTNSLLLIGLGSYYIYINQLSIQSFIAFMSYSNQFLNSLKDITTLNSKIQQVFVSLDRIFSITDNLISKSEKFGIKKIKKVNGNIVFNNVSFSYVENEKILKNITFEVPKQKLTAIVGKSGSGKSTIVNLLLKFYNIDEGTISIDDCKLEKLDEYTIRKNICPMLQEVFFYNLSIKENLLILCDEVTLDEIYEVCKAVNIHDYIMSLPEKYDTIIEENSVNFSGGQKQRLALARCILRKASVVILDEPTSSLDNESEFIIRKAIEKMLETSTVILITHKLHNIINADQIIIIDQGMIVGKGTHKSLIKKNKNYTKLYNAGLEEKDDVS